MKLCVDCKHYRPVTWCWENIHAPFPSGSEASVSRGCMANRKMNPVDGKPIYQYAVHTRNDPKRCGPDATWFEPKG